MRLLNSAKWHKLEGFGRRIIKGIGGQCVSEMERLRSIPRFHHFETNILGPKTEGPDAASFIFMHQEIFQTEIYRFECQSEAPFIIDCGANIGLSVIYLKRRFPKAKIVAFEPDPFIFGYLKRNSQAAALEGVELRNVGVWDGEGSLPFFSEGADGGRIAEQGSNDKSVEVKLTSLRPLLDRKVDFLKIDIEGAEHRVLPDIRDQLSNVERIFVEYHSLIGQKQNLGLVLQCLEDAGFRIHVATPGLSTVTPFMGIPTHSGMDLQMNIYGLREANS